MPRFITLILLLALLQPVSPVGQSAGSPALSLPETAPKTTTAALPEFELGCGYDPAVDEILAEVTQEDWSDWVRQLSGDKPALVGGKLFTINTRYSRSLFNGGSPAYDFVREQVAGWYPAAQIEEHSYDTYLGTLKNLILTIPGTSRAEEVVLLTAHLDSTSPQRETLAPGADDNATGSAALLEAARVMQGKSLPRTLRLIWFTGEEQGLLGSRAYTTSRDLSNVVGVINVDMIGYDADNDRCFELHVGTLPESQVVGRCFIRTIAAYNMDLLYEYKTSSARSASDHSRFWAVGVGAVMVLENYAADLTADKCPGANNPDRTPNYHQTTDTYSNLNQTYAFDLSRASLAAAFSLASPQLVTIYYMLFPMVKNE